MATSIAEVYAESLFEVAEEALILSDVARELTEIGIILTGFPELTRLLSLPTVTAADKAQIVKNVFGGRVSKTSEHFLAVLSENRRILWFEKIAAEFRNRYNKACGDLDVTITSAAELSEEQKAVLIEKLKVKYKRNIKPLYSVDAAVMGGMVIDIEGRKFDGTVKTKLENMKQLFTSVTA